MVHYIGARNLKQTPHFSTYHLKRKRLSSHLHIAAYSKFDNNFHNICCSLMKPLSSVYLLLANQLNSFGFSVVDYVNSFLADFRNIHGKQVLYGPQNRLWNNTFTLLSCYTSQLLFREALSYQVWEFFNMCYVMSINAHVHEAWLLLIHREMWPSHSQKIRFGGSFEKPAHLLSNCCRKGEQLGAHLHVAL